MRVHVFRAKGLVRRRGCEDLGNQGLVAAPAARSWLQVWWLRLYHGELTARPLLSQRRPFKLVGTRDPHLASVCGAPPPVTVVV